MNLRDTITENRQSIDVLVQQLEELAGGLPQGDPELAETFRDLGNALEQHGEMVAARYDPLWHRHTTARTLLDRAHREHEELGRLLYDLEQRAVNAEDWLDEMTQLRIRYADHIAFEQQEVFPQLDALLEDFVWDEGTGPVLNPDPGL